MGIHEQVEAARERAKMVTGHNVWPRLYDDREDMQPLVEMRNDVTALDLLSAAGEPLTREQIHFLCRLAWEAVNLRMFTIRQVAHTDL